LSPVQLAPVEAYSDSAPGLQWQYMTNDNTYGPVSMDALTTLAQNGTIMSDTPVRREDESNWRPASDILPIAVPSSASGMRCLRCNAVNAESAYRCSQCGEILRQSAPAPQIIGTISSNLFPAILCTLFCFFPFGIVAIIYAAQVKSRLQVGDYTGALAASKNAAMWCWIAFVVGLMLGLILILAR